MIEVPLILLGALFIGLAIVAGSIALGSVAAVIYNAVEADTYESERRKRHLAAIDAWQWRFVKSAVVSAAFVGLAVVVLRPVGG